MWRDSAAVLGILEVVSGEPAWKKIPSWYLVATEDRAIPPATQRFMAERAGATIARKGLARPDELEASLDDEPHPRGCQVGGVSQLTRATWSAGRQRPADQPR